MAHDQRPWKSPLAKFCMAACMVFVVVFLVMAATCPAKSRDKSRFYSAALLEDGRTVLFTYTDASYRLRGGSLMGFGGGQPHYTRDSKFLCIYHMDRKKTTVIHKIPRESGTQGRGNLLIRGTVGFKAVILRESRQREGVDLPHEWYLLDARKKRLRRILHDKEMADLGMKTWRTPQLIHTDGSLTSMAYAPDQKDGYNLGHLWLRRENGEYRLLTKYGSRSAAFGGDVFYYDHTARTRHVLNLETGEESLITNREYADQVPDNLCNGRPCLTRNVRVGSDGKGLSYVWKVDGEWKKEPLSIDMEPLR